MRVLDRLGIPRVVAALGVVLAAIAVVVGLAFVVAQPAQDWFERAPRMLEKIELRASEFHRPLAAANAATERVLALGDSPTARQPSVIVRDAPASVLALLVRNAPAVVTSALAATFLTFLLLLYGDALLRKFVALLPGLHAKKELVAATREAQSELSHYLFAITTINLGLGAVGAGVLWLLGMPDPLLWGGLIALANFAPYVGPAIIAILLLGFALAQFPELGHALAVPGAFLTLHAIEGQVVTPLLVGRRLALDPVVLFLGLMVIGWLWGIAGLLMAVPLIACMKVVAGRLPGGASFGHLLAK